MELGLSLEYEDFGQTRDRTAVPKLTSFNAKVAKPLWFVSEAAAALDLKVSENNSQLLKFTGDYHYRHDNYAAASELYIRSLAVLPHNSQATRLDVRQSLARCYLYLGREEEADDIAQSLLETAQNIDHKKQSTILKLEVTMAMKRWEESEHCLHFLIGLQQHFTRFWLQLALVCHQRETQGDGSHRTKIITCYVRAKLLLQSTMAIVSEVIRQRDQVLLQQVNTKLEELSVPDKVMEQASEFLRFDLKQERWTPDGEQGVRQTDDDTNQLPKESPDDFYNFWCAWAKSTLPSAAAVDT